MRSIFSHDISQRFTFLVYRFRFLMSYVVIGGGSIGVEILIFRGIERLGFVSWVAYPIGLAAGILFAYWLNVRFNFKVPKAKRNRAFTLFVTISCLSATINLVFRNQLEAVGWRYETSRFVVAGTFFLLGYVLHRRFSFADYKKVGVAIYANGVEDIRGIHDKIGSFPDFIHVDIIDSTFGDQSPPPASYRLEVIHAYWRHKQIQAHVMSRTPTRWVRELAAYVDTVCVHVEIDESVEEVLKLIRSLGKKAGVSLTMATPLSCVRQLLPYVDVVMLLTIACPGKSGQQFDMEALARIAEINKWNERGRFCLCIDGGVNETNIGMLNVENVVSGSSVLNSQFPTRQIMRLQTSGSYEAV